MQTMILVPDDIFEQVSLRARALRTSRSEFFARAAGRYLDELEAESTTQQINFALGLPTNGLAAEDRTAAEAVATSRRLLAGSEDDW